MVLGLKRAMGAVAATTLITLPLAACSSSSDGDELVIGMIEDTSGGTAATSAEATRGIELAIQEINDAGGIDGRTLTLVSYNDGGEPSKSPALVRRLINDDAKIILMNSSSASAAQVKPVVEQEQIPAISPTNIAPDIAEPPNNTYSYTMANPVTDIGTVYAEAFTEADYQTIAVLTDDSPTMAGLNKALLPMLEEAGTTIVATEEAALNSSDVTAQVSRVGDSNPDAVLVSSLGGQLELLFQDALSQQMPSVPRFSLASIGNQPETWELAEPGSLNGLVYASSISPTNPRSSELAKKLKAEYDSGFKALTSFAAQGYDSVYLIKKALENAGADASPDELNAALEEISEYPASFGGKGFTLSFSAEKHIGSDGLCGIVLRTFNEQNQPGENWDTYQPACDR